jgi:cysteinyl-tRNA synthetase
MSEAAAVVERIRNGLRALDEAIAAPGEGTDVGLARAIVEARTRFFAALEDDLGTPEAFAALLQLVRAGNAAAAHGDRPGGDQLREARRELVELLDVFGLASLAEGGAPAVPEAVMALLEQREAARAARDFARADALRAEIAALGWELRDTPEGPQAYPG